MATLENSVVNVDEALLSAEVNQRVEEFEKKEKEEKEEEKQSISTNSSETDNSHTSQSEAEAAPKESNVIEDEEDSDNDSSSTSSDTSTSSTSDKTYLKHSLTLGHRDGSTLTISAFTLNGTPCFEINGFTISQEHLLEYLDELTNQDQDDDETEEEIRVKELFHLQNTIVKAILVLILALFLALWLSIVNYGLK